MSRTAGRSCGEVTAGLVRDRGDLRDLGEHRLRDLARVERVWQVGRADFPPLRSLMRDRHNLPVPSTPMLGRESEVVAVVEAMARSKVVTLTGSGGIGKTRLALQIATEVLDRFEGGVWWVDLATISESDAVARTVLAAVGGTEQPGVAAVEQLVVVLRPEAAIAVVLDNCEHVADGAAAVVARIVGSCAGVTFLATSREPLGVAGEITWRVASLAVPEDATVRAEDVEQFPALALFWDRARRARPQLEMTDANLAASVRICRRVDGIALAIELAAARCRQFAPERLASELEEHYRLLVGGARNQLARQRTLEASVDWSFRLLDGDERTVFRRVAVFVGWFPLDAAAGVASSFGDLDEWAVTDLVANLVDKSLLVLDDDADDAEPRYRMLETMRFYALERARDAGELAALHDAHVQWWCDWAGRLDVPMQLTAEMYAAIDAWYPNLRAALQWASEPPDGAIPLLLGLPLYLASRDLVEDLQLTVAVTRALHEARHPHWRHVVSRMACPAIMIGDVEFLLGPVTEAYESAIVDDQAADVAECLFGLGFLDPTGARWVEMTAWSKRAGVGFGEVIGRASYHGAGLEPLSVSVAELRSLHEVRDHATGDVAVREISAQLMLAANDLGAAKTFVAETREVIARCTAIASANRLWSLAQRAEIALLEGDDQEVRKVLVERADRRFRGVPLFWSGNWVAAIDVAAFHLLAIELDIELAERALDESTSDVGHSPLVLVVQELLDRRRLDAVRRLLERADSPHVGEHAAQRLAADALRVQLAAAEGELDAADRVLARDVLRRGIDQDARAVMIDVIETVLPTIAAADGAHAARLLRAVDEGRASSGRLFRFPNRRRALDGLRASGEPSDAATLTLEDAARSLLDPSALPAPT